MADLALGSVRPLTSLLSRRAGRCDRPAILLLRLERIGDLLMALDAIRAVRLLAPDARIDLVVGSWNEGLARMRSEWTVLGTHASIQMSSSVALNCHTPFKSIAAAKLSVSGICAKAKDNCSLDMLPPLKMTADR